MRVHLPFRFSAAVVCFTVAAITSCLRAQVDPSREIQEIAEAVERQLQEIDELLLESGKQGQQRDTPRQRLDQARERFDAATDGIDKLIEKLQQMKGKSSSSSSGQNQQGDPSQEPQGGGGQQQDPSQQDGRSQGQNQGGGTRRENQNAPFVQQPQAGEQPSGEQAGQPQQQPGQEQQQQQDRQGGNPQGGDQNPEGGQNRPAGAQPDAASGEKQSTNGAEEWGNLPSYLNFLKNRGATPTVPSKFRRYYEAWMKEQSKDRK